MKRSLLILASLALLLCACAAQPSAQAYPADAEITSIELISAEETVTLALPDLLEGTLWLREGVKSVAVSACSTLTALHLNGYDEALEVRITAGESLETLRCSSGVLPDFSSLASSKIRALQINDRWVKDLTGIEHIPQLNALLIFVDPSNGGHLEITGDNIDLLDSLITDIPIEQLRAFVESGGEIFCMHDFNRPQPKQ